MRGLFAILFAFVALSLPATNIPLWRTPSDTLTLPWSNNGFHGNSTNQPPTFPNVVYMTNMNNWSGQGVADGVTDNSKAWTNALAAALASLTINGGTNYGAAIVFTPGTWVITNLIALPSNVSVRGYGGRAVIVGKFTNNSGGGRGDAPICVGMDTTRNSTTVTSGLSRGSTSLTLTSAAGMAAGNLIRIYQYDDPNTLNTNKMGTSGQFLSGHGARQGQNAIITAVDHVNQIITIDQPLIDTNWSTVYNATVDAFSNPSTNFGLENICLTNMGTSAINIYLYNCYDYWISSVFSTNALHSNIELEECYHGIIQDSDTAWHSDTVDSNAHEGCSLYENSTGNLIVNCNFQMGNIAFKCQECINNTIAYCSGYIGWVGTEGSSQIADGMGSHGFHSRDNLYEGNACMYFSQDEFWGDNRTETAFRNYVLGWGYGDHTGTTVMNQQNGSYIDSTNYWHNWVLNVLQTPRDIGWSAGYSIAQGYARSTPENNFPPSTPYDANTLVRTYMEGNYDMRNGQQTNVTYTGGEPASLVFPNMPWWFTNTYNGTNWAFPMRGVDVVNSTNWAVSVAFNPADWRWRNGTNCFIDPWITTQPQSQNALVGQSVTFTASTVGNSVRLYQWQKNGVNIAGATGSSFNIASVQTTDAALYTAFVQDQEGTVLSANAALNVGGAIGGGATTKTYGRGTLGRGTH